MPLFNTLAALLVLDLDQGLTSLRQHPPELSTEISNRGEQRLLDLLHPGLDGRADRDVNAPDRAQKRGHLPAQPERALIVAGQRPQFVFDRLPQLRR
jgi:hypothetical protein